MIKNIFNYISNGVDSFFYFVETWTDRVLMLVFLGFLAIVVFYSYGIVAKEKIKELKKDHVIYCPLYESNLYSKVDAKKMVGKYLLLNTGELIKHKDCVSIHKDKL